MCNTVFIGSDALRRRGKQLIVRWREEFPFNFIEKLTEDKQIWSTHTLFSSYLFIKKKSI